MKNIPNKCLTFSIRQEKKKKVNSYNGLQTKFSDCAFKTKKKKKKDKQCITKTNKQTKQNINNNKKKHNRQDQTKLI